MWSELLIPLCWQIERVQNVTLWQNYQLMKKQLEVTNKHNNNEKLLFHGTVLKAVDLINKQGFNRSYAGTHGMVEYSLHEPAKILEQLQWFDQPA